MPINVYRIITSDITVNGHILARMYSRRNFWSEGNLRRLLKEKKNIQKENSNELENERKNIEKCNETSSSLIKFRQIYETSFD